MSSRPSSPRTGVRPPDGAGDRKTRSCADHLEQQPREDAAKELQAQAQVAEQTRHLNPCGNRRHRAHCRTSRPFFRIVSERPPRTFVGRDERRIERRNGRRHREADDASADRADPPSRPILGGKGQSGSCPPGGVVRRLAFRARVARVARAAGRRTGSEAHQPRPRGQVAQYLAVLSDRRDRFRRLRHAGSGAKSREKNCPAWLERSTHLSLTSRSIDRRAPPPKLLKAQTPAGRVHAVAPGPRSSGGWSSRWCSGGLNRKCSLDDPRPGFAAGDHAHFVLRDGRQVC